MCRLIATSSRLGFTLFLCMLFTPSQAFPGGSAKISKAAVFFNQRHFRWYVSPDRSSRTWRNPVTCQERNKNTKCPIDAHCHHHCRKDRRITKDCIEVLQVLSFWVFIDFGKKFLRTEKLLDKVEENSEAQNLQNLPILCNPWICSAMAMAMSIYRTLCVLVYFKPGRIS